MNAKIAFDRMTVYILIFTVFFTTQAETDVSKNCKDILRCVPNGQAYQPEGSKRDSQRLRDVERSFILLKEKVDAGMKMIKDFRKSSIVYTRWGKKTCPSNADLVFSGYTGGSWFDHLGAAVEPLCLPRDPEWGVYKDGRDRTKAFVFGAEYHMGYSSPLERQDVPCAVCLVRNKSVVKMFPARKTCYKGWKLEYNGYLMAGHYGHNAGTKYTCMDSHPDTLQGGQAYKKGKMFFLVEAMCGSLRCPPYVHGRELVYAVCSKE